MEMFVRWGTITRMAWGLKSWRETEDLPLLKLHPRSWEWLPLDRERLDGMTLDELPQHVCSK